MKLYITKFWTEEQNFCFCIFNMILCKSQEVRINLKMYFLLNIVSTLKSENICFNSTRQKCTEFNSYQEKWSRLKFQIIFCGSANIYLQTFYLLSCASISYKMYHDTGSGYQVRVGMRSLNFSKQRTAFVSLLK